jgi:hypothetical protein
MKLRSGKVINKPIAKEQVVVTPITKEIEQQVATTMITLSQSEAVNKCRGCGKHKCDLFENGNNCCSCSDKRLYKNDVERRGHGIYYYHHSWSYCPHCQDHYKWYSDLSKSY